MNDTENAAINNGSTESVQNENPVPQTPDMRPGLHAVKLDKIAITITAALLFLFFGNFFFPDETYWWAMPLLYTAMTVFTGIYVSKRTGRFEKKALPAGIAGCILSLSLWLWAEEDFTELFFICIVYLTAEWLTLLSGANRHKRGSYMFLNDVFMCFICHPFENIGHSFSAYRRVKKMTAEDKNAKKTDRKKHRKTVLFVLLGIVAAVIVLAVVLPLLSGSDANFGSFIDVIFDGLDGYFDDFFDNISDKIFSLLAVIFFTAVSLPIVWSSLFGFASGLTKYENRENGKIIGRCRKINSVFFITLLSIVSVVYLVFTVFQFGYLFSVFTGRMYGGQTVVECAKEGFSQMVAIAAVNLVLVGATIILAKRNEEKIGFPAKILNAFLCVFTVFISVVSLAKIILYMNTYGLTEKRVCVFVADIVVIITFVCILIRLMGARLPYMRIISVSFFAAMLLLGTVGIKPLIATVNYNLYVSGKTQTVDCATIYSCGYSGMKYLEKLASSDMGAKDSAKAYLLVIEEEQRAYQLYDYCYSSLDSVMVKNESNKKAEEFLSFVPDVNYTATKTDAVNSSYISGSIDCFEANGVNYYICDYESLYLLTEYNASGIAGTVTVDGTNGPEDFYVFTVTGYSDLIIVNGDDVRIASKCDGSQQIYMEIFAERFD